MALETYVFRLGMIIMEGEFTNDQIYDNQNEFISMNTIFQSLTMIFLESTFQALFTAYCLVSLLFVVRLVLQHQKSTDAASFPACLGRSNIGWLTGEALSQTFYYLSLIRSNELIPLTSSGT